MGCCHSSTHAGIKVFQRISGNSWYRLILCLLQCLSVLCNAFLRWKYFKCQMWQSGWFSEIQSHIVNTRDTTLASWGPGSLETYRYCSHTLSFSLRCQKEFSCFLVWRKESLAIYKIWYVHRVIPKLHCCIVKVCWFSYSWLLDCLESKNARFSPFLDEEELLTNPLP